MASLILMLSKPFLVQCGNELPYDLTTQKRMKLSCHLIDTLHSKLLDLKFSSSVFLIFLFTAWHYYHHYAHRADKAFAHLLFECIGC